MKKTPPRLLARTLTVTFATVAVILTISFIVITLDVRDRVRAAETEKLRVSENVFTALETKRQQDQVAAMATLAENPTLKAALDTYFTERRFSGSSDEQLRATVTARPRKLATQTPADVLAVVENDGRIFTSAGRPLQSGRSGQNVDIPADQTFQNVAVLPSGAFRITGARLTFGDSRHRRARLGDEPRCELCAGALEPLDRGCRRHRQRRRRGAHRARGGLRAISSRRS